jgi:hypothetical protein
MKKVVLSLLLMMLMGCAGTNASVPVNVATDVAFVLVLQNNPTYKAPVIAALEATKTFVSGKVTYDDLIAQISKQFGGQYAYVGVILQGYLDTDKPVFETYLPLLDSYKAGIIAKIDRLILLAGSVG